MLSSQPAGALSTGHIVSELQSIVLGSLQHGITPTSCWQTLPASAPTVGFPPPTCASATPPATPATTPAMHKAAAILIALPPRTLNRL